MTLLASSFLPSFLLHLSLTCTSVHHHVLSPCTCIYVQVCKYERLSPLVPLRSSLEGDFGNVRDGDCVVVFSRHKLFEIRRKIQKATKKPCAVIYGGLPSGVLHMHVYMFLNER